MIKFNEIAVHNRRRGASAIRRRDRKVKLELTVSQAVALYYAAGALRDDILCAMDKEMNHAPVSGSRKTDRIILKSLELLAVAIRKATD
jgi:hypothetical protein